MMLSVNVLGIMNYVTDFNTNNHNFVTGNIVI